MSSPNWKEQYESEKTRLLEALGRVPDGGIIDSVEHIGATSVPGMQGSTCIDIGLAIWPFPLEAGPQSRLEALGYQTVEGADGRQGQRFRHMSGAFQLFLFEHGIKDWYDFLLVGDYLRHNDNVRDEISAQKSNPALDKATLFSGLLPAAHRWWIEHNGFAPLETVTHELREASFPWFVAGASIHDCTTATWRATVLTSSPAPAKLPNVNDLPATTATSRTAGGPTSTATRARARSTARREGNEWVLNGEKMWISLGDVADHFLFFCWTDQEKQKVRDHSGISCFIVERTMPGFSSGTLHGKLGIKAGNTLFLSGMTSRSPETYEPVLGDVGTQTRRIFGNMGLVLKAAGMDFKDLTTQVPAAPSSGELPPMMATRTRPRETEEPPKS